MLSIVGLSTQKNKKTRCPGRIKSAALSPDDVMVNKFEGKLIHSHLKYLEEQAGPPS
jgi:hypothetical protein